MIKPTPNGPDLSWKQRLKDALIARNRTQLELAAALGLSDAAVSQWISGATQKLSHANVVQICMFLNIDQQWLISGVGSMDVSGGSAPLAVIAQSQQVGASSPVDSLVRAFEFAPSESQVDILRAVRALSMINDPGRTSALAKCLAQAALDDDAFDRMTSPAPALGLEVARRFSALSDTEKTHFLELLKAIEGKPVRQHAKSGER